jgi:hypothetical protein
VPYDEKLIGDPDTGVIAGGVVTALLDHACGQAVHTGLTEFKTIATLDLRIDYMRPAEPGRDIFAKGQLLQGDPLGRLRAGGGLRRRSRPIPWRRPRRPSCSIPAAVGALAPISRRGSRK